MQQMLIPGAIQKLILNMDSYYVMMNCNSTGRQCWEIWPPYTWNPHPLTSDSTCHQCDSMKDANMSLLKLMMCSPLDYGAEFLQIISKTLLFALRSHIHFPDRQYILLKCFLNTHKLQKNFSPTRWNKSYIITHSNGVRQAFMLILSTANSLCYYKSFNFLNILSSS